jgi:hypothetical protein
MALCFDVPDNIQTRIEAGMTHPSSHSAPTTDIYAFHVIILDLFIELFDNSVWSLRNALRQIETVKNQRPISYSDLLRYA